MSLPRGLQEAVKEQRLIPFVGAGVSRAVTDKQGKPLFPNWGELLQKAAERLEQECRSEVARLVEVYLKQHPPDYLRAAEEARTWLLGSQWGDFLTNELRKDRRDADDASLELASGIWELGSCLVITTNYDPVLSWACPNPHDLVRWQIEAPHGQVQALRGRIDRPTVWHLHGSLDDVSRLILAPRSYKELYRDERYTAALNTLRVSLTASTLLFVGFSMADAYFLDQLRWVKKTFHDCGGPHYALFEESEAVLVKEKIRALELPIQVVEFKGFGAPLVRLVSDLARLAPRVCV